MAALVRCDGANGPVSMWSFAHNLGGGGMPTFDAAALAANFFTHGFVARNGKEGHLTGFLACQMTFLVAGAGFEPAASGL